MQITLLTLLYSTFAFFGIHSLLWFIRGLVEVLKHGRPHGLRPGQTAYVRFVSFHRIGHTIMMSSFLGLALTGLPLKYRDAPWAKSLARTLGGFASTEFLASLLRRDPAGLDARLHGPHGAVAGPGPQAGPDA